MKVVFTGLCGLMWVCPVFSDVVGRTMDVTVIWKNGVGDCTFTDVEKVETVNDMVRVDGIQYTDVEDVVVVA